MTDSLVNSHGNPIDSVSSFDTLKFLLTNAKDIGFTTDSVSSSDIIKVFLTNPEQSFSLWITNPNTIIAITAIVISIIGLWLASKHNRQTFLLAKTHNELSVKPFLHYSSNSDIQNGKIQFKLSNKGLGPAIIKSLKYEYDNYIFDNITNILKEIENKGQLNFPKPSYTTTNDIEVTENAVLFPNDHFELFSVQINPPEYINKIIRLLSGIKIKIVFQNIYQNNFLTILSTQVLRNPE